jgi:hypothetical protein
MRIFPACLLVWSPVHPHVVGYYIKPDHKTQRDSLRSLKNANASRVLGRSKVQGNGQRAKQPGIGAKAWRHHHLG